MRPGEIGMVLDRALTPSLLDLALRVGTQERDFKDARRILAVALRDRVSPQESEGKTKKCLSRVWVAPPEPARPMIRWAVEHQSVAVDRSALHFGAMLATFPFAGAVAALVGRQLHISGEVDPKGIKEDARAAFGDRSTIDVGARKVLTTMRYLGLLEGPDGGPFVVASSRPTVGDELSGWLLHALLLTRQVESIGVEGATLAPELSVLHVQNPVGNYPLLEFHSESSRTVAVERKG